MDVFVGLKNLPSPLPVPYPCPLLGASWPVHSEEYRHKSSLQPGLANLCTSFKGNSHVLIWHGVVFMAPRDSGVLGWERVGRGQDRTQSGGQGLRRKPWALHLSFQSTSEPRWCASSTRACSQYHPHDVAHLPGWQSSAPGPRPCPRPVCSQGQEQGFQNQPCPWLAVCPLASPPCLSFPICHIRDEPGDIHRTPQACSVALARVSPGLRFLFSKWEEHFLRVFVPWL